MQGYSTGDTWGYCPNNGEAHGSQMENDMGTSGLGFAVKRR